MEGAGDWLTYGVQFVRSPWPYPLEVYLHCCRIMTTMNDEDEVQILRRDVLLRWNNGDDKCVASRRVIGGVIEESLVSRDEDTKKRPAPIVGQRHHLLQLTSVLD